MFTTRNFTSDCAARQPDFKERVQIIIGCATHPFETHRWLRFLQTHPLLRNAVKSPGRFLGKIHRPYLSNRLTCGRRVDLLIEHYSTLYNAGFGPLLRQAMQKPLTLCTFAGKSDVRYELQLSALEQRCQDGELLLRLVSEGVCIYTIAFVVTATDSGTDLKVGGLKGLLSSGRGTGIKQVTRDLYGCRPKELMVSLARDLGRCFGCNRTQLIGNRNRIPSGDRHVCRKSSDYDRTWEEMHAVQREDGDYELPCASAADALRWRARHASSFNGPLMPTKRSVLLETIRVSVRANVIAHRSTTRYIFTSPLAPKIREEALERLHM